MDPTYFASAAELRAWLAAHHATAGALLIGFYKKSAAVAGLSQHDAVDEALCYGWIDGVVRRVDDQRYAVRFSPRKPHSTWSLVNVQRAEALIAAGRMQPPGLAAWAAREAAHTGRYSFEQAHVAFDPDLAALCRGDAAAWAGFQAQAPSYCRAATWWVMQAKQEATRRRRLARLMEVSAQGERLPNVLARRKE